MRHQAASFKIIDAHTHVYPAEVIANPRAWAEARGESHWADLVAPTDRPSIQGWSNPESMLADMDACGVEQAVLLGWYWTRESTCRWHNEVMAEWRAIAPDRFIAFAAIVPNENVIDQLESAQALGFRGVGELHFGVQSFDTDNRHWQALAEWCLAHGWPVNFHATETAGKHTPDSVPTPLQEFVRMAEAHPELTMILAHWGGGLPFFEQNPKVRKILRNVYYDSAASPLLYDTGIFRRMIDLVGIEKLVFGSDYPLRVYPRLQKKPDMRTVIERIQQESGLDEGELQTFLGNTFEQLLGRCHRNKLHNYRSD
jgi:predicted TIM-barrel fold metal-dependent hydrolase